jgi:peptidoglycan/LPS O-acetylase OafA/YrhL
MSKRVVLKPGRLKPGMLKEGAMNRLATLESLRGLLAVWVVIGHILGLAYTQADLASVHLGLLYQPVLAVYVFMILSGFVIFYLLDHAGLSYSAFIGRRVLRLAPLYLTVLLAAVLTRQARLHALQALPWHSSGVATKIAIANETAAHFWQHLAVHLTLLQSLVPESLLKFSDYTFLGPAWSISLELQFYLIAPILFALVKARRWLLLGAIVVFFTMLKHLNYLGEGFFGRQSVYFAIGMLSYFVYKQGRKMPEAARAAQFCGLLAAAMLYSLLFSPWSLMVWAIVLPVATFGTDRRAVLLSAIGRILEFRGLRWLGKISYSIYLWHPVLLLLIAAAVEHFMPAFSRRFFLIVVGGGTLAATVAVSAVTFRFIESPGMRLGKRLGEKGYSLLPNELAAPP